MCILNGEGYCARMRRCRATEYMAPSEMTLRHFNGNILFFYTEIDTLSHFYINILCIEDFKDVINRLKRGQFGHCP